MFPVIIDSESPQREQSYCGTESLEDETNLDFNYLVNSDEKLHHCSSKLIRNGDIYTDIGTLTTLTL